MGSGPGLLALSCGYYCVGAIVRRAGRMGSAGKDGNRMNLHIVLLRRVNEPVDQDDPLEGVEVFKVFQDANQEYVEGWLAAEGAKHPDAHLSLVQHTEPYR